MKVAFVVDPLESLDPALDSTIGLMHAAQDRGHEVWTTRAATLEVAGGRVRCLAHQLRLAATHPAEGCRWLVAEPWYTASEPQHLWLDDMTAVFVRPEPPFDDAYRTTTLLLDLVDPIRTAVVNSPSGLRECSEHLFPLRYPDLIPPTVVTADRRTVRAFVDEHRRAVVKPVDGFGGHGVLLLDRTDVNLPALLELTPGPVILQPYLPEVADGNKRIFLLDGEPTAAVLRYPVDGDFRIQHPSQSAPLTARDREICGRLAPALRRMGIRIAGLDVIGPHLIEVNVTCPGALRKADALFGWTLCDETLDAVLTSANHRRSA